nr:immunoglobulin heavy chain junction region [Mus musculus]
CARGGSSIDYW